MRIIGAEIGVQGRSASGTLLLPMKLRDLIAPKLPRFAQ
jgi:hypothetical protein